MHCPWEWGSTFDSANLLAYLERLLKNQRKRRSYELPTTHSARRGPVCA